jgi:hypothetical protein
MLAWDLLWDTVGNTVTYIAMQFNSLYLIFLYGWTFFARTATANPISDIPLCFAAQQTNFSYSHLLIRASTNLQAKMWNSQTHSPKFPLRYTSSIHKCVCMRRHSFPVSASALPQRVAMRYLLYVSLPSTHTHARWDTGCRLAAKVSKRDDIDKLSGCPTPPSYRQQVKKKKTK